MQTTHLVFKKRKDNHYQSEKEFVEKYLNGDSKRFMQLVRSDDSQKALVYTPVGKELKKGMLRREHVLEMLDCVEELHSHNIIHRDLSPKHFLQRNDTGSIFLIDFGSALFTSKQTLAPVRYKGSLQFAAREILDCLAQDQ
jgi:serine/threonine protein kinase